MKIKQKYNEYKGYIITHAIWVIVAIVGIVMLFSYMNGRASEKIKAERQIRKEIEKQKDVLDKEIKVLQQDIQEKEAQISDLETSLAKVQKKHDIIREKIISGSINEDDFFKSRGF